MTWKLETEFCCPTQFWGVGEWLDNWQLNCHHCSCQGTDYIAASFYFTRGMGLVSQHASQVTWPGGGVSGFRGSASRGRGLHKRGSALNGRGSASRGICIQGEGGLHPGDLHMGVYIKVGWADTPGTRKTGGMHPIWMLSCFSNASLRGLRKSKHIDQRWISRKISLSRMLSGTGP